MRNKMKVNNDIRENGLYKNSFFKNKDNGNIYKILKVVGVTTRVSHESEESPEWFYFVVYKSVDIKDPIIHEFKRELYNFIDKFEFVLKEMK